MTRGRVGLRADRQYESTGTIVPPAKVVLWPSLGGQLKVTLSLQWHRDFSLQVHNAPGGPVLVAISELKF
jgi:hypothetical protein